MARAVLPAKTSFVSVRRLTRREDNFNGGARRISTRFRRSSKKGIAREEEVRVRGIISPGFNRCQGSGCMLIFQRRRCSRTAVPLLREIISAHLQ